MVWTYRHFHWLGLFYVLVATQGGHFVEHVVQMVQIHVLDRSGPAARGVFGELDVEWVHFGWNTWVLLAVVLLLVRYRRNPWLRATLVIAGWHEIEHAFILTKYLATDVPAHPGLLSEGGAVGGGLSLARPDLHFLYNLAERAPLFVAFAWTLKRSYDDWLARALPTAGVDALVATTKRAAVQRFGAGDVIISEGDAADRFYVLARGEVEVLTNAGDTAQAAQARLGPGAFFGEMGMLSDDPSPRTATVRAVTAVEVLTLDRSAFQALVEYRRPPPSRSLASQQTATRPTAFPRTSASTFRLEGAGVPSLE